MVHRQSKGMERAQHLSAWCPPSSGYAEAGESGQPVKLVHVLKEFKSLCPY